VYTIEALGSGASSGTDGETRSRSPSFAIKPLTAVAGPVPGYAVMRSVMAGALLGRSELATTPSPQSWRADLVRVVDRD
jgi:hypothetical protein